MADGDSDASDPENTISDEMIDAAAQAICDSGITPYPCYPHRLKVVAREILEAAMAVRLQPQSRTR
jgi:hypothetical protein